MAKYKDKTRCRLKSDLAYIRGESAAARHKRRLMTNRDNLNRLRAYCGSKGFAFTLIQDGLHWRIEKHGVEIDWFPSTAKFIVNQNWKHGIHVHDISQVICYLEFLNLVFQKGA
jgi:hypothetical protein